MRVRWCVSDTQASVQRGSAGNSAIVSLSVLQAEWRLSRIRPVVPDGVGAHVAEQGKREIATMPELEADKFEAVSPLVEFEPPRIQFGGVFRLALLDVVRLAV